jgi:hypothetical protein
MRKYPSLVNADALIARAGQTAAGLPDGRYVEARPLGWPRFLNRLRFAWLVFTGRCDALEWTGQPAFIQDLIDSGEGGGTPARAVCLTCGDTLVVWHPNGSGSFPCPNCTEAEVKP